jgi:hypothetical protein
MLGIFKENPVKTSIKNLDLKQFENSKNLLLSLSKSSEIKNICDLLDLNISDLCFLDKNEGVNSFQSIVAKKLKESKVKTNKGQKDLLNKIQLIIDIKMEKILNYLE